MPTNRCMQENAPPKFKRLRRATSGARFRAGLALAVCLLAGCSSPAVRQQRLVAKPTMTFSESAVFMYNSSKLFPQVAAGFATSGGGQNSGCTSCR